MDKKKVHRLHAVQETLAAARADDVLEIDAMWSYVGKKGNRVWLWSALCRRTRQIVAFGVGRSARGALSAFVGGVG